MVEKAHLFVIAAPSGGGKTSLTRALVNRVSDIKISISSTTRPPRPGEQERVDYFFVDKAEFNAMVEKEVFLEYAEVFGNYYGTSRQWVEEQVAAGIDVLLEI